MLGKLACTAMILSISANCAEFSVRQIAEKVSNPPLNKAINTIAMFNGGDYLEIPLDKGYLQAINYKKNKNLIVFETGGKIARFEDYKNDCETLDGMPLSKENCDHYIKALGKYLMP